MTVLAVSAVVAVSVVTVTPLKLRLQSPYTGVSTPPNPEIPKKSQKGVPGPPGPECQKSVEKVPEH